MKQPDEVLRDLVIQTLSPFGVKLRYPGDLPELSPGQETTAFELARRTRETIMSQLGPFLPAA